MEKVGPGKASLLLERVSSLLALQPPRSSEWWKLLISGKWELFQVTLRPNSACTCSCWKGRGGPAELPVQARATILPLQQRACFIFPPCHCSKETRGWGGKRSVGWPALLFPRLPVLSMSSREAELVAFAVSGTGWTMGQVAMGGWGEKKEGGPWQKNALCII